MSEQALTSVVRISLNRGDRIPVDRFSKHGWTRLDFNNETSELASLEAGDSMGLPTIRRISNGRIGFLLYEILQGIVTTAKPKNYAEVARISREFIIYDNSLKGVGL